MDAKYFHAFVVTVGLILGLGLGMAPIFTTENQVFAQGNTTEGDEEALSSTSDENATDQQVQELSDGGSKKDKSGPTIVSRNPNVNTVSIPVNTNIEVKFSEPVKKSSVSDSTFMLKNIFDESEIPGLVLLDDTKTTATFAPTLVLGNLQSYTVTLTSGIKDLAGNSLNPENWSFTTEGQSSGSSSSGSSSNTAGELGIKTAPGGEVGVLKEAAQYEEDSKLLDRLLPILYKKIDINTIIAKADGKKLLEKVLPYLDIIVITRQQDGNTIKKKSFGLFHGDDTAESVKADCNQDEVLTGGGFRVTGGSTMIESGRGVGTTNTWVVFALMESEQSTLQAYAQCMKVELGLKVSTGGNIVAGKSSNLGVITKPGTDVIKEPVP